MPEHNVYILLGSNVGDRYAELKKATQLILSQGATLIKQSSIYETAAWGHIPQSSFLNQVIEIKTLHEPNKLMQIFLGIEQQMGRIRGEKMGPRIIDLDILFYDSIIFHSDQLTIPHPLLQERRFVLEPMSEIAPEFKHPFLQKTIKSLLLECKDNLEVSQWKIPIE